MGAVGAGFPKYFHARYLILLSLPCEVGQPPTITPAPQEDRGPGNHCSQVQPVILVLAHGTPLLRQETAMEPVRGREAGG